MDVNTDIKTTCKSPDLSQAQTLNTSICISCGRGAERLILLAVVVDFSGNVQAKKLSFSLMTVTSSRRISGSSASVSEYLHDTIADRLWPFGQALEWTSRLCFRVSLWAPLFSRTSLRSASIARLFERLSELIWAPIDVNRRTISRRSCTMA